jgi:hypothetical protein
MINVFPHKTKAEQKSEIDFAKWKLGAYLKGAERAKSLKQRDTNMLYVNEVQTYLNYLLANKKS